MGYNYNERGPCCDRYDELKRQMRAKIKTLYALVGGNPRYWVQLLEIMRDRCPVPGLLALALEDDNQKCPCHDAPDPVAFRRFYGTIQAKAGQVEGKKLEAIMDFLDKEAKDFIQHIKPNSSEKE